ncbi:MAG: outer membrane lipoprotein chaperone LolA [Acidobacteria bacterium]|nr:outer membrane lipoprotein chaperone LolA [Acidobacteriota bacterium]
MTHNIFKLVFKLVFTIILLMLVILPSQAENEMTKKLIVGLEARYGNMKGLVADFTQIYRDRAGRKLQEQGTLQLKRPGKMRWDYREPEEKIFIVNDKTVYFYLPLEKEVTVAELKETDDPRAPFVFLLGRRNLQKDFKSVEISTVESPIVAGNIVLELVPKRISNTLKRLFVEIEPKAIRLSRIVLINANDGRSDFILSNFKENSLVDDSRFEFVAPEGVKVLR